MSRSRTDQVALAWASAVALAACSKPAASRVDGGPSLASHLFDAALEGDGTDDGDADGPDVEDPRPLPITDAHTIALSRMPHGEYPPPGMDMAPGELPSPEFPAGTVYVARFEEGHIRVTEWDLATKHARRSVVPELPDGYANVRIAHLAGAVHLLPWIYNDEVSYVRLTEDLRVVATRRLGTVSPTGPMGLAADDALTVVAIDGTLSEEKGPLPIAEGVFAIALDAAGRIVARRKLDADDGNNPSGLFEQHAVAFLAGKVFVALSPRDSPKLEVVRLDRRLHLERWTLVSAPATYIEDLRTELSDKESVALVARSGRLFVDSPRAHAMIELSLAGTEIGRAPRSIETFCKTEDRMDADIWVGREHVTLWYGPERGPWMDVMIHWVDASGEPGWVPSCPP